MKINKSRFFIFWILLTLPLLAYQNCSKVDLASEEVPFRIVSSPLDLKSSICADTRIKPGSHSKFVFIVDLSASNFGNWISETVGGRPYYYWDSSLAFDPQDARFSAIENFLDQCAKQSGNQFALIGFSGKAGVIDSQNKLSCTNARFTSPNQIKQDLKTLKSIRARDEQWYKTWTKPHYFRGRMSDSLLYGATSYSSATSCLEHLILTDLESNQESTNNYNVFFLSDGLPEDDPGTGCNQKAFSLEQKNKCYLENSIDHVTMSRTAVIAKGRRLTIQGIFYGNKKENPHVLNAISVEGGTAGIKFLDGFENNQTALCDFVVSQHAHEYKPDIYSMINLNVSRIKGELTVDSDSDGLSDDLEISLGYDPGNPRSKVPGVLDGICERLGGQEECTKKRNLISCQNTKYDSLGLSDCDYKILGLHSVKPALSGGGLGVDTDGDGLPDYIEIIKGTNPAQPDMLLDPDQDGVLNRDEILNGTDLYFSDKNLVPLDQLNHYELQYNPKPTALCEYGEWQMNLKTIQASPTQEVSGWPESFVTHNKKVYEQTLLFIYRLAPMNTLSSYEYYYHFVKVTPQVKEEPNHPFEAEKPFITPDSFMRILLYE
jgi:hypothetical protein